MLGKALVAALATIDLEPPMRDRILARLGGPVGREARAAVTELAQSHTLTIERALRATWAASARSPVPAGIRGIHPSWIEVVLRDLPAVARAAVATGGAAHGGAVWLARWACATLPPMPAIREPVQPATLDDVVAWSELDLTRWLHDLGADQLAFTANAAGGTLREAMLRRYPAVQRAVERIGQPPRHGQLGPLRAAVARCRGTADDLLLLRIGARCIAPHLADEPFARRQIVLRFTYPTGITLDAELAAWAKTPLAQAPSWCALGG